MNEDDWVCCTSLHRPSRWHHLCDHRAVPSGSSCWTADWGIGDELTLRKGKDGGRHPMASGTNPNPILTTCRPFSHHLRQRHQRKRRPQHLM